MPLISLRSLLPAAVGLAFTAACGGGSGGPPPESAAAVTSYTVEAGEWDSLAASGEASYAKACGACHPGGQADLGPAIADIGWETGHMYTQIRQGSGRMGPVPEGRLPEADMKGLFVYLATLGAVSDVQKP